LPPGLEGGLELLNQVWQLIGEVGRLIGIIYQGK